MRRTRRPTIAVLPTPGTQAARRLTPPSHETGSPPDSRRRAPGASGGRLARHARARLSRADRRPARDQRVHHPARRAGPGGRRTVRAGNSRRTLPGAAARHSRVGEGSNRRRRLQNDIRLGTARDRREIGRASDRTAQRGRRGPHRKDEPPRVRLRHHERGIGFRPRSKSARPVSVGWRIERRRRRRARRRHVLRRARHRHRRIDPHPIGGLRHGRAQGHERRDLLRGRHSPQHDPRPPGTDGPQRRGRRAALRRAHRAAPERAARGNDASASSSAFRAPTSATGSTPGSSKRSSGPARR